jgi:hypothetical protein
VRFWAFVILGAVLGGCARDPYVTHEGETRTGDWFIAHQIDRVTATELPSAIVFALASNTNVDYPRVSQMQLTCLDGKPLVRFAFDFKIGRNRDAVLGYRFDNRPGHEDVESRVLRSQQIVVIEQPEPLAEFLDELSSATIVYVRVRSLDGGRTAAEYPLDGVAQAMKAAFANCPLPPAPTSKRTS